MLTQNQPATPAANPAASPSAAAPLVTMPLVTMIVLCYNQARFVVETLESVKAQTYKHTELIIIDDCSSDDSVAVINRWLRENNDVRCTFIPHQKNQGICKSLNEALALTSGKYISMIAADDIWLPDKIERQVAIMESQPDSVGVLYTDAFRIGENGRELPQMFVEFHRRLPEIPQGDILDVLVQDNFIPGMTTLIRRACYSKVGLYDENLPWEDWDMWLRIARRYSFIYSATPSAKYREHEKSYSHSDRTRMRKDAVKICIKQIRMRDLTEEQKSKLAGRMLHTSEELYKQNDPESCDTSLAVWRATGRKRAQWMYRFTRLGISFQNWQRACRYRAKLRRLRSRLSGTP
jgi:glycosyltransferase involved in cell wall biosynthesis